VPVFLPDADFGADDLRQTHNCSPDTGGFAFAAKPSRLFASWQIMTDHVPLSELSGRKND